MPSRKPLSRLSAFLPTLLLIGLYATPAWAAPGGTGLERAGSGILSFMSGTLGPIVLGLGLAIAAYGLIFSSREGLQKAVWVAVGGVMLFSVESIVAFIQGVSR